MIQALIYTAISQSPDVIALAGNRIYPIRLPREALLPAVVYRITRIEPVSSLSGDSGIDNNSIEIVAWAKEYGVAHQLAYAVRNALVAQSGLRLVTESQDDDEDLETRSYAVFSRFNIWSAFNMGSTPVGEMNPILEIGYYAFDGDSVTTDFSFPQAFRANSLILFINGRVAQKGVEYTEKVNLQGVVFPTAPAGDPFKDMMLAYYAKA